jgi:hypothetical protein
MVAGSLSRGIFIPTKVIFAFYVSVFLKTSHWGPRFFNGISNFKAICMLEHLGFVGASDLAVSYFAGDIWFSVSHFPRED